MRQFILTVFGTIIGIFGFFITLFLILMMFGIIGGIGSSFKPKDSYVLTMDLRHPIQDHSAASPLFGTAPASVVDTVRKLNVAKYDKNVKGLFIRARAYGMTPASAEELRLAIKDFKSSGKFVVTFAQGFESTSFTGYMAVSASDEIWQQDTTNFSVAGIRSEVGFYGGVFEKIGAQPQILQFHEYKSAANAYNETGFTEAHRESTTSLLQSLFDVGVDHIAKDRGMSVAEVTQVLQTAPHSAKEALDANMVDKLGHYQTAKDYTQKKAGGKSIKFKSLNSYILPENYSGPAIAFIGGQGAVMNGSSSDGSNPFNKNVTMGSDTVAAAITAAAKDKNVKVIVFRVSSPGGSPSASDQIHDAVHRAKEAGKPVVISMGQYAASGGYYVAANSDKIVALPMTITGSIGVLGGKVALEDSYAKLGYNVDDVNIGGEFVSAYSGDKPFSETQLEAYRGQLSEIYEDFTSRVAKGRNMSLADVKDIAKGRVWTGSQGVKIGLVDAEGGFLKAVEIAKELGGIEKDDNFRIKVFPRPKTTQQQIEEIFSQTAQMQENATLLQEIATLPEVQAFLAARAKMQPGQELTADLPEIK